MLRLLGFLLVLSWGCCCGRVTLAQAPADKSNDRQALLSAAQQSNNIYSETMKPWHLVAIYDLYDDDGKPLGEGTFEESWVSKDEWKQSYTGDHYTGALYHSAEGTYLDGDHIPWPENLIVPGLLSPIKRDPPEKNASFKTIKRSLSGIPALCLENSEIQFNGLPASTFLRYCFATGSAAVLMRSDGPFTATYNKIVLFQGQDIGFDTTLEVGSVLTVRLRVKTLSMLDAIDAVAFSPKGNQVGTEPAGAEPNDLMKAPRLVKSKDPAYPLDLRVGHVGGTVLLRITVGQSGIPTAIHVLQTPSHDATISAKAAVSQYRFKPATFAGRPIDTDVTVSVRFNYGH